MSMVTGPHCNSETQIKGNMRLLQVNRSQSVRIQSRNMQPLPSAVKYATGAKHGKTCVSQVTISCVSLWLEQVACVLKPIRFKQMPPNKAKTSRVIHFNRGTVYYLLSETTVDGVTWIPCTAGLSSTCLHWSHNSVTIHSSTLSSGVRMLGLSISTLLGAGTAFSLLLTLRKQQR